MRQRFEAEELDDDTLQYLRAAHARRGEGMPGVYAPRPLAGIDDNLAGWGAIVGVVLLAAVAWWTWDSLYDPLNVAMLQTAALLLGGWLILAWVRCRRHPRRADYVGNFYYLDPLYLWEGTGRGVWVTPVEGVEEAAVQHNRNKEGNYTGSQVQLKVEGAVVVVPVPTEDGAEEMAAFAGALPALRHVPPAQRGYRARAVAEGWVLAEGAVPGGEVGAIPEPHRARRVFGAWRYAVLLAAGVVLFWVCWRVATVRRDDAFFEAVKDQRPPQLRAYLIDARNTRHRAEVQRRLDRFHEQAADRVLQGPGEKEFKEGLTSIILRLRRTPAPVLTIALRGSHDKALEGEGSPFTPEAIRARERRTQAALAAHLSALWGDDMTAYGEAPAGEPAMVEVDHHTRPAEGGYQAEWTVTFQDEPGGRRFVCRAQTSAAGPDDTPERRAARLHEEFVARFKAGFADP